MTITARPTLNIELQPCDSSQISGYGYHAESKTLAVKFSHGGAVYHYFDFPQEQFNAMLEAESKGSFFGKVIRNKYAFERQPDVEGVVFGLTQGQEPKYTASSKTGRLVNRATGKPIPDDEPVFVLRAQDIYAVPLLHAYLSMVKEIDHSVAVRDRITAFEDFALANPARMKEPDAISLAAA